MGLESKDPVQNLDTSCLLLLPVTLGPCVRVTVTPFSASTLLGRYRGGSRLWASPVSTIQAPRCPSCSATMQSQGSGKSRSVDGCWILLNAVCNPQG